MDWSLVGICVAGFHATDYGFAMGRVLRCLLGTMAMPALGGSLPSLSHGPERDSWCPRSPGIQTSNYISFS